MVFGFFFSRVSNVTTSAISWPKFWLNRKRIGEALNCEMPNFVTRICSTPPGRLDDVERFAVVRFYARKGKSEVRNVSERVNAAGAALIRFF